MPQKNPKTATLTLAGAVLVALAALPALAQAPAASVDAPQGPQPKAVAIEPVKDFEVTPKGEKLTHDFLIRNDGAAPLEITSVKPSCGCTVAEYDKSIAPGATGKVHAVVETSTFEGPIAKGITVMTSDPANPRIELTVKANVKPYIAIHPGYARYIYVQGEAPGVVSQNLWAEDGFELDVLEVKSPYEHLKAEFHPATPEEIKTDGPPHQWRIVLTLDPKSPIGPLADHVIVTTNHPKQPEVKVPISGFVRPILAVTPPEAKFGSIEFKGVEPHKSTLLVVNYATDPIKVTRVETTVPNISAELKPIEEGRRYQVQLTMNPNLPKGEFKGKLRIHTDAPKKPVVEVDLNGSVL